MEGQLHPGNQLWSARFARVRLCGAGCVVLCCTILSHASRCDDNKWKHTVSLCCTVISCSELARICVMLQCWLCGALLDHLEPCKQVCGGKVLLCATAAVLHYVELQRVSYTLAMS